MDWSPVISDLRPGEAWTLHDCTDLSTRVWNEASAPPTPAEIEAHRLVMLARPAPPLEE